MKQKDIAYLVLAISASAIAAYFISNAVFGSTERTTKVEVVDAISSDFEEPSDKFFNSDAINPTQNISIGGEDNTVDPFDGGQ